MDNHIRRQWCDAFLALVWATLRAISLVANKLALCVEAVIARREEGDAGVVEEQRRGARSGVDLEERQRNSVAEGKIDRDAL